MYNSGIELPKVAFSTIKFSNIVTGSFFVGFDLDNGGKLSKMDHLGNITVLEGISEESSINDLGDVDTSSLQAGDVLSWNGTEWVSTQIEGVSPDVFTSDFTVVLQPGKTFGKYLNGQTVPALGKTAREVILDAAVEYLPPAVTFFDITSENSTVETGYKVIGTATFGWSFSNSTNVTPNSVSITDVTNSTVLASGLANDGSEIITLPTAIFKNSPGQSHQWKVEAQNTQLSLFNSTTSIVWRNKLFYAPRASAPVNSAEVRALGNDAFYSGSTTFTLNTGSTLTNFYVALPPGKTITSVVDLDALNAVITASYVLLGTINVNDVGTPANTFAYNLYGMTIAIPYASNHRHSITISN